MGRAKDVELEQALAERNAELEQLRAERAALVQEKARLSKDLQDRDTELTELLDQQAATSEILRIVSSSPTDLHPVFDTILASATRLCGAQLGFLGLFDGEKYEYVAMRGGSDALRKKMLCGPLTPVAGTNLWRTLFERRSIHVEDMQTHQQVHSPAATMLREGARTLLSVPMLKEGLAIGTIVIYRFEVRPFLPAQIELASTFANQAVIAIENVRLFKELQTRNAELADSLEQQMVTSEILRIISGSPTDTQPVFDAIVKSGVRLFGGLHMSLRLVKGDYTEIVATTESTSDRFPTPINDASRASARAIMHREVIQLHDTVESVSEEARRLLPTAWATNDSMPSFQVS